MNVAHDPPPTLRLGDLFAERYVVEERIGAGGMGAVYRVTDTFVGETIALKLATIGHEHRRAGPQWELLRSEVAMARRVTHPRVARVFDLGRHGDVSYITMAYVPGPTLHEALADEPLPVVDVVRIAHHVASALAAAHAAGVLHLDLKPANIVISDAPMGGAVLVDFGIARALGARPSGMGTADFVAPEQLEDTALTGAADVFALGCVLHVALTGRHTFVGGDRRERMLARLTEAPLPLPTNVPASLAALVVQCLAREPSKRPTAANLERAFVDLVLRLDPGRAPAVLDDTAVSRAPRAPRVDLGAFAGGLGRRVAAAREQLLCIGREHEALATLDDVLANAPDLDVAIALRALALVRLWNRSHASTADERNALGDRAVQAVTDAVARAPHLADTHLADALIADYSGDVAYAVRALRRAHDIEPLHAFSHEVLGRIELEGCVSGVDRLLLAHELDPRHLGALVIVARERFLVGRDDEAEAFLRRFDAGHGGPKFETLALRLRRRLWRRDRIGAQPLVDSRGRPLPAVLAFLNDCVSALHGELSTAALVERAARAAEETMSPKRKCFVLQIAVEGLAAVSSADALRHLLSAAELPLADLRWLDECPALEPLRASTAFIAARNVVKARIDDAFYGAAPARPAIRAEVTATEVDPRPPSPVASPTGSTVEHSAVDHGAPTMVIGNRRRPLRTLPTIVDNPPD